MTHDSLLSASSVTFRHTGYIVKDMKAAAEAFSDCFPMMDKWKFCTVRMSAEEVVDGRACHLIVGVSRIGTYTIELIQAMDDWPDCYHMQAPEGINHLAFVYPDEMFDSACEMLTAKGFTMPFAAHPRKSGEKCYYFQHKTQPLLIEINNKEPDDPEYDSLAQALEMDE